MPSKEVNRRANRSGENDKQRPDDLVTAFGFCGHNCDEHPQPEGEKHQPNDGEEHLHNQCEAEKSQKGVCGSLHLFVQLLNIRMHGALHPGRIIVGNRRRGRSLKSGCAFLGRNLVRDNEENRDQERQGKQARQSNPENVLWKRASIRWITPHWNRFVAW